MFLPGTKIMVISEVFKKPTSPKAGSLGYSMGGISSYDYYHEYQFATCPTTIMFTRYGNEEKHRQEIRSFLAILPILSADSLKKNVYKKKVAEFSEALKEDKDGVFASIAKDTLGEESSNAYFGLVMPVFSPTTSVLDYSKEEWNSWLTSILRSPNISGMLSHIHRSQNKKFVNDYPVDHVLLKKMLKATQSSDERKHLIKTTERTRLAHIMRFLLMLRLQHYRQKNVAEITQQLAKGEIRFRKNDHIRNRRAINGIATLLFTPLFDEIKNLYMESGRSEELRPLVENLINWRRRVSSQPAG